MVPITSIQLVIADAINNAHTGTYRAPTFAGLNTPYTSGNYYSMHSFTTAQYYSSEQTWEGNSSVVMRGDPIMAKGEYGRNNISSGSGKDFIYSDTGNYLVAWGGEGNDTIFGHDSLDGHGEEGNDVVVAGVDIVGNYSGNYVTSWKSLLANAESMTPSELGSHFIISNSNNELYGGAGHDVLIAPGDGNNKLYADGTGYQKPTTPSADDGNDLIIAGDGNNTIYGGGGNDTIYVGSGENRIYAGSGDDVVYADEIGYDLDGGDGFDIYSFAFRDSSINLNANFWAEACNFEGVVGTIYDDSIMGSGAADQINGYNGNDTLDGRVGNDLIFGDGGNDSILGGVGNDTLYGNDGHDTINGGLGDDYLIGGTGNDSLYGETGNDFYFLEGAFGSDNVFENAGEGTDDRIVFNDLTLNNVVYGRNGNDLLFADSTMTNGVFVKDWFVNFGVDSFWFTTGTGQYNYVSAEVMAGAFNVTIPTGDAVANTLDALVAEAATSDILMNAGDNLAPFAVAVTGVDFGVADIPPAC